MNLQAPLLNGGSQSAACCWCIVLIERGERGQRGNQVLSLRLDVKDLLQAWVACDQGTASWWHTVLSCLPSLPRPEHSILRRFHTFLTLRESPGASEGADAIVPGDLEPAIPPVCQQPCLHTQYASAINTCSALQIGKRCEGCGVSILPNCASSLIEPHQLPHGGQPRRHGSFGSPVVDQQRPRAGAAAGPRRQQPRAGQEAA